MLLDNNEYDQGVWSFHCARVFTINAHSDVILEESGAIAGRVDIQGYLAYKKTQPPRTLP